MEWTAKNVQILPHLRPKLAKGIGLGSGAKFKPWESFRSEGRAGTSRIRKGLKTGRVHDLPSASHRALFMLNERRSDVLDIREGFPILQLDHTLQLCAQMGVAHPKKDGLPDPVVIDFLITRRIEDELVFQAQTLFSGSALDAGQQPSLLDVQRAWCQPKGIDWYGVSTTELTQTVVDTLDFFRGWVRHRYVPDDGEVLRVVSAFGKMHSPSESLRELITRCARRIRIEYSRCENAVRYAGWTGAIRIDPFSEVSLDSPLILLRDE